MLCPPENLYFNCKKKRICMYLDEQKLLLCGIDHGFSTMKTVHFVFENGVKELGDEASLLTNTMF